MRQYTILSITLQSAEQIMFTMDPRDGQPAQTMSVAQVSRADPLSSAVH